MFHGESKRLSKTLGIYKMEDDYEPLELKWKMGGKWYSSSGSLHNPEKI